MAKRRKKKRRVTKRVWRKAKFVRLAVGLALLIVVIPLVLTPLYKVLRPISTLMIYEWMVEGSVSRQWVPLDEIAGSLVASVVMSEDGKYCSHKGIDWDELDKALEEFDERPRGASTVAMQTVKNLFLWTSRSYFRKAVELLLAQYADAILGKRRLMEIYLNIAEFGPRIFGAEAAAQHYFKRSAAKLTQAQSALLTASLPNPAARDPANPSPNHQARARAIEEQARIAGAYIDCLYP